MKSFLDKYQYLKILLHILSIVFEAGGGVWLIFSAQGIVIGTMLTGIALLHIAYFSRQINTTNKKISLFFNAIEDNEAMLFFSEQEGNKETMMLNKSFNKVNDLLARAKIKSKKQELFFRSLLSKMPDGIVAWNSEGKVEVINQSALQLLACEHLIYVHQLQSLYPELEQIITSPDIHTLLLKIKTKNRFRQLAISKRIIRLEYEQVSILTIKDINQELMDKETESWNKLTHVLTHEIMNTIAPIVSLSETLSGYFDASNNQLSEKAVDRTRKGLKIIRSHSKRLMNFTESYRHLSFLPIPVKEIFDMTLLFEDIKMLLIHDLREHEIILSILSIPSATKYRGDRDQLSQVFINMIKNAIQSLNNKAFDKKIEIKLTLLSNLIIEIWNNGEAIPKDIQDEIFVPFFTTKSEGTGIGLSVSKQIVRLHDGEIFLHSSLENGTTFRIELPIIKE